MKYVERVQKEFVGPYLIFHRETKIPTFMLVLMIAVYWVQRSYLPPPSTNILDFFNKYSMYVSQRF